MKGLLKSTVKKFLLEVKSPRDAMRFCGRVLLPVDPHVRESHSWIWGNLPRLELSEVMPGAEDDTIHILDPCGRARVRGWSLSMEELTILLAIVKSSGARRILEIGTFDGGTALNLAANTAPEAKIVTVDLPPNWGGALSIVTPKDYQDISDRRIVGKRFLNTVYQHKITQVFGDSAVIDWSELSPPFDIAIIDGCHYRDYVASDTKHALKHIRPGGLVIWHDYGFYKDVSDVVDATASTIAVRALAGTRYAIGFPA